MDRVLNDYLPDVLRGNVELESLLDGQQPEVSSLWDALDGALQDQFPATAGEYGIARWEELLGEPSRDTDTLEDRRFRVLARLSARLPYTEAGLRRSLAELCGGDGFSLEVDGGSYTLTVRVALASAKNFDAAETMVRQMAPANLVMDISLLYRRHQDFESQTHGELAAQTHGALRGET